MEKKTKELLDAYPEHNFLLADGFETAIVGVEETSMKIIYSVNKCIDILMKRDNMDEEDAIEFFEFNTRNSFVGDQTPIWMNEIPIT
jgi:hypothetical protein